MQRPLAPLTLRVVIAAMLALSAHTALAARGGQLRLEVVDRDSGQPLACRMHLRNAAGKVPKLPGVAAWQDHLLIDGEITLRLPVGGYTFDIERGPEYLVRRGNFTIVDFADDAKRVDLKRIANMAEEGWWAGDLESERPLKDIALAMRADELYVVQAVTWSNQRSAARSAAPRGGPLLSLSENRFCHALAGADRRAGGAVLLLGRTAPLRLPGRAAIVPTSVDIIRQARREGPCWVDAPRATAWDLPVWVALGLVDSVELAGNLLTRAGVASLASSDKPADRIGFPGKAGPAQWSQAVYYHLLNSGLRIPPTAGSGSGANSNPLGYNRVYVHVDGPLTYAAWWSALRQGRVTITNGPLLRPRVEGELPGHVFRADAGQKVELEIGLTLSTQEHIDYLEMIKDGRVAAEVRLDDFVKTGGKLPPLVFDESGWFLIRVVSSAGKTYRFASTGPYYVEIGYKPRVSRASAQLFADWTAERLAQLKTAEPPLASETMEPFEKALAFWKERVATATAP